MLNEHEAVITEISVSCVVKSNAPNVVGKHSLNCTFLLVFMALVRMCNVASEINPPKSPNPSAVLPNVVLYPVKFSGEVLKNVKIARYEVDIKKILRKEGAVVGLADGKLYSDSKAIYEAEGLKVGLFKS